MIVKSFLTVVLIISATLSGCSHFERLTTGSGEKPTLDERVEKGWLSPEDERRYKQQKRLQQEQQREVEDLKRQEHYDKKLEQYKR